MSDHDHLVLARETLSAALINRQRAMDQHQAVLKALISSEANLAAADRIVRASNRVVEVMTERQRNHH